MLLLLFLFVLLATSAQLSAPVSIVNGRSLRVDILSGDATHRRKDYRVTTIVACSSIDVSFRDYDPQHPERTGCNSPGFQSEIIFPSETSLFKARQRYSTLFMRRRLVVMQSPIVYLQVHMVQEEGNKPNATTGKEYVAVTQYRVPEKVLPLSSNGEEAVKTNGEEEEEGHASLNAQDDESSKVLQPGQFQWYEYTGFLLAGMGLVACLVAMAIYQGSKRAKHRLRSSAFTASNGSYADKRSKSTKQLISTWFTAAVEKGVYTTAADRKSNHPLL